MRQQHLEQIVSGLAEATSTAVRLVQYFNEPGENGSQHFDPSKPIYGTEISFADCTSRLVSISDISKKLKVSEDILMLPTQRVMQLKQKVKDTEGALENLAKQFRHAVEHSGGSASFNYDNFHLATKNGQNHDFRAHFKNVVNQTEELLEAFFQVLFILRPTKGSFSFQAAANSLSTVISKSGEQLQEIRSSHQELKKLVEDCAKLSELAKQHEVSAKSAAEETGRTQDEAGKDRRTIGEYLSQATEKKTSIESVYSDVNALQNRVTEYKDKFDAFDRQLKDREKNFELGQEQQAKLFKNFAEQEESVDRLIEKSESMLKGATVAGLASSFSDAHRDLGDQLFWARISFYAGIAFLFISSLPLMFYVFLPALAPLLQNQFPEISSAALAVDTQGEISGWQYLGQVLARFIILLPAAWLVSFSAIRHSSLFRLREHYAYKYSMAVSVEGFRKQAEGYESEVAALVLEQLAFNPADKLTPSREVPEGKIPRPMFDSFLHRLRTRTGKE
jgi:hypothetical protein